MRRTMRGKESRRKAKRPGGIDTARPFEISLKALFYEAGLVP
jgi:hypothetical protein